VSGKGKEEIPISSPLGEGLNASEEFGPCEKINGVR
jgi:hypothetical protein